MDVMVGWGPTDRDAVLHTVVGGGGAMLVAYALFAWTTERATVAQARALAAAGIGFLMSAGASVYLRHATLVGGAISIAGCVVVLGAMRAVLRDRLDRQHAERRRAAGGRGE